MEPGTSSASMAWRFVQYGVPSSPGIGGAQLRAPVLSTTALVASKACPSTTTRPGPSRCAHPRTNRAPRPVSRSTAAVSSQVSVASLRIRSATGASRR